MKHDYADVLDALELETTDRRLARLQRYEDLLRERALPLGMIARSDRDRLRPRHVVDALRGAHLVRGTTALDLGSGAGIPGIPLAIVSDDTRRWWLVEPRRRRAAFLELVVEELGLANVQVEPCRAQDVRLDRLVDVVVARAFAPPAATWSVAAPLLAPAGALVVWVGAAAAPRPQVPGANVRLVTSPVAEMGPIAIMTPQ